MTRTLKVITALAVVIACIVGLRPAGALTTEGPVVTDNDTVDAVTATAACGEPNSFVVSNGNEAFVNVIVRQDGSDTPVTIDANDTYEGTEADHGVVQVLLPEQEGEPEYLLLSIDFANCEAEEPVETVEISAKALDDHGCNATEWHFVITQIESEELAPESIEVTWANGDAATVPLDKVTGGTAHYATTDNLDSTVVSATADIYPEWEDGHGQFNLSHGPCDETTTTTTNETTSSTTSTTHQTGVNPNNNQKGGTVVEGNSATNGEELPRTGMNSFLFVMGLALLISGGLIMLARKKRIARI